jgi:cell division protein FtsA|tara:strand:+ start:437 stop:1633 length:1197 start_codon:yes stop_codon:yes gene_type:complete
MNKKNFDIYIDLGASKVRAAVFEKNENNQIFFLEKNCLTFLKIDQVDLSATDKVLEKTILEIEKKTGEYVNNINLMLDSPDALSISLSVSKKNEKFFLLKEDVEYLIQDAKQQILSSYQDKDIIHIIINNYKINDTDYDTLQSNIECNKFSIDLVFICFSKEIIKNLVKLFSKHQVLIDQFICTSYAKSFTYKENFSEFNQIAFLDIGYEKTSILFYEKEKIKLFDILSIGGHHITKDISKILNVNIELSEKIKLNLNKDIIFSDNEKNTEIFKKEFLDIIKEKELSFDLIKKIIFARIEETLNLSFKTIKQNQSSEVNNQLKIILIGEGSKILDNKYIDIRETTPMVEEIDFFEESTSNICQSGLKLLNGANKQEVVIVPKKLEKKGLFERLFYFFK